MQNLATDCPEHATGQAQQECSSILVERPPMTSNEAESRGRLLAFQWAPYCLRLLCDSNTFIAHIACSTPRRPPYSVKVRASTQTAPLSSEKPALPADRQEGLCSDRPAPTGKPLFTFTYNGCRCSPPLTLPSLRLHAAPALACPH
jgi:hypothetical protein